MTRSACQPLRPDTATQPGGDHASAAPPTPSPGTRPFGTWFRVKLDQPFVPGGESTGQMTYPGYEHVPWKAEIVAMDEPRLFSFRWPHMDEKQEVRENWAWTLVEFRLEPTENGTRLTVTNPASTASRPSAARKITARTNRAGRSRWATSKPMPSADQATVFAALGDRTRLALLMTLSDGRTRSIAALSADAEITRQAVTKHLRVLENAGLVVARSTRAGEPFRSTARDGGDCADLSRSGVCALG